jgi:dephospho-CoA kinase
MLILGVTGSIGSGKSFVCKCFARMRGVKIISSDAEVHRILKTNKWLIKSISEFAPTAVKNGQVDRVELGNIVFNAPHLRERLEQLIYPTLAAEREAFIRQFMRNRTVKILVLDIPLLFEKDLEGACDLILTVYCRQTIQKQRVLRRNKMTEAKFNAINALQIPPHEKVLMSDFSINSGLEKATTFREVKAIYQQLTSL